MASSEKSIDEGRIHFTEDAPEIDLNIMVLENQGLVVDSDPFMGRVIRSSVDLLGKETLYRPILREYPVLVCKQQDYMDFMEKFLDSPIETQVGILDMFYQPLESAMGKSLIEPAKALYLLGALEDFTIIHQLLSILMTNGHQYKGSYTAIPLLGTKFAHSCSPNIGYASSASEDGALEYIKLRPIKEGELACFSYMSDLLETPTPERRDFLMETKSFWCCCERCRGRDYCRCMPCLECNKSIPCLYNEESNEPYWVCPSCGPLEPDILLSRERQYSKLLEVINRSIENRKDFKESPEYTPKVIKEVVGDCQMNLSQTHHLTVKALRLLFTTSTTFAYVEIRRRVLRGLSIADNKIHRHFRDSIVTGFRLVLACECVAAECSGCQQDHDNALISNHDPQYDRALVVQHVCDNLLRLPVSWWPPLAVTMTKRYLSILRARFGSTIDPIEKDIVDKWEAGICYECSTYWDATRGTTQVVTIEAASA